MNQLTVPIGKDPKPQLHFPTGLLRSWEGKEDVHDCVSIGKDCHVESFSVAVGCRARAGKRACAIGTDVVAGDDEIVIGKCNFTRMMERLDALEQRVAEQDELIEAIWYHPGMPGFTEAKETFDDDSKKL